MQKLIAQAHHRQDRDLVAIAEGNEAGMKGLDLVALGPALAGAAQPLGSVEQNGVVGDGSLEGVGLGPHPAQGLGPARRKPPHHPGMLEEGNPR